MNRNLLTLILVLFSFFSVNASNGNTLITIYDEHCQYSLNLLNITFKNKKIENLINNEFTHKILKQSSKEAQELIEKYEIVGFPVQIIKIEKKSPFICLGFLNELEEFNFLNKFLNRKNENTDFQEMTPFEKYVFKESGIGYDIDNNRIIGPTKDESYKGCIKKENPSHYQCRGLSGTGVIVNRDSNSFRTSVFAYKDEGLTEDGAVSTTSFVENGKVIKQSYCFYDAKYEPNQSDKKQYFLPSLLKCYTVTPNICNIINKLNTVENYKDISLFNEFVSTLKSTEFKEKQLDIYKESYRNIFLYTNERFTYKYYSKISDGYYDIEKQGKAPLTSIFEMENQNTFKQCTNFAEFYKNEKMIFTKAFLNPCKGMIKSGIMTTE
ncbi:hypothetical protein [Lacinutrix cladophorae]